jgi:hypothetical protein
MMPMPLPPIMPPHFAIRFHAFATPALLLILLAPLPPLMPLAAFVALSFFAADAAYFDIDISCQPRHFSHYRRHYYSIFCRH